ncbi:hypothetical protein ACJX0J_034408, partial [Zea mays]
RLLMEAVVRQEILGLYNIFHAGAHLVKIRVKELGILISLFFYCLHIILVFLSYLELIAETQCLYETFWLLNISMFWNLIISIDYDYHTLRCLLFQTIYVSISFCNPKRESLEATWAHFMHLRELAHHKKMTEEVGKWLSLCIMAFLIAFIINIHLRAMHIHIKQ